MFRGRTSETGRKQGLMRRWRGPEEPTRRVCKRHHTHQQNSEPGHKPATSLDKQQSDVAALTLLHIMRNLLPEAIDCLPGGRWQTTQVEQSERPYAATEARVQLSTHPGSIHLPGCDPPPDRGHPGLVSHRTPGMQHRAQHNQSTPEIACDR